MNYNLKLDNERINFLIDLLLHAQYEDENERLLAKEIYTDLSIMTLEDDIEL